MKKKENFNNKRKIQYSVPFGFKRETKDLAREIGVYLFLITSIKTQRENIMIAIANIPLNCKNIIKSSFNFIDTELYSWFLQQRQKNILLSQQLLLEKTNQIPFSLNLNNFSCNSS